MILGQFYDLALWPHPWPWPLSFKVRVLNSFISGMGQSIDNERKGCESSIHDHYNMVCIALFLQRALYTVHCTLFFFIQKHHIYIQILRNNKIYCTHNISCFTYTYMHSYDSCIAIVDDIFSFIIHSTNLKGIGWIVVVLSSWAIYSLDPEVRQWL